MSSIAADLNPPYLCSQCNEGAQCKQGKKRRLQFKLIIPGSHTLPATLRAAIRNDHETCLTHILEAGADVVTDCGAGRTVFHYVAEGNKEGLLSHLREKQLISADSINRADNEGNTPLHVAYKAQHYGLAADLLAAGASVAVLNAQHKTPLHVAFQHRDCPEKNIFRSPLKLKANDKVDLRDDRGRAALHYACSGNACNEDDIRSLLATNADPNAIDAARQTPLMLLCSESGGGSPQGSTVRRLLEAGADPSASDNPLYFKQVVGHCNGNTAKTELFKLYHTDGKGYMIA